jgi:trk system potassium uptake protein TrkH
MNHRIMAKYLGLICMANGTAMLPCAAWAIYFDEVRSLECLLFAAALSLITGLGLRRWGRDAVAKVFEREAIGLVGITWILVSAFGALPFMFLGVLGPNDAFFESVSGFTTTGSTVLTDIESVDKSLLFWRSLTHWLGGIGIVILFIAVLPYIGAGGKLIVRSETTGPTASRPLPRFRESATLIFKIYLLFTFLNTAALMWAGMNLYEALIHTFGGLATGGFSNRQGSIGEYDSLAIETVIITFMVVGGTSFGLFAAIRLGEWNALWKDSEWRLYIAILVGATALVALNLTGFHAPFPHGGASYEAIPEPQHYELGHAVRVAAFQVVSCMTDTGYATDDFDRWPYFSRMTLVILMIVGGSAGSTSSGFKVLRLLMYSKLAYYRLESTFRPKTVRVLRINGEVVNDTVQNRALTFLLLYLGWFVLGCLFLSLQGLPFDSAVSAMIACLNNCGPGLEHVGAARDFHLIGPAGTAFLSLTMLLGRLELVTILVLFMPSFWRR